MRHVITYSSDLVSQLITIINRHLSPGLKEEWGPSEFEAKSLHQSIIASLEHNIKDAI